MTTPTINRPRAVLRRIGVSRSTVYQLIKCGQFKAPISPGACAAGWLESDVSEFIETRVKASRKAG